MKRVVTCNRPLFYRPVLLLILVLKSFHLYCQPPAELLNNLNDSLPLQTISVHHDKGAYFAGDTIWFKAYLFSDFKLSDLSSNLFADFVSVAGKKIISKHLPVINGTSSSYFKLPDTLSQGVYVIRIFTPWSLNLGNKYICTEAIPVFNPRKKEMKLTGTKEYNVTFFFDGNDLTGDIVNTISFKVNDRLLNPAAATGIVETEDGKEVTRFSCQDNGLGSFTFIPESGRQYIAAITFSDQTKKRIKLPFVAHKDVLLSVFPHEKGIKYSLIPAAGNHNTQEKQLLLIGHIQNYLLFEQKITLKDQLISGIIPFNDVFPGILHLTLFDEKNNILSEQSAFMYKENKKQWVEVKATVSDFSSKAKNSISLIFPDSLEGEFSISVTDADKDFLSGGDNNIKTDLLLRSYTKNYIPDISAAIDNNNPELLNLIAKVSTWNTPDWKQLYQNGIPKKKYLDNNFISIQGNVFKENSNKLVREGEVLFFVYTKDSSKNIVHTSVSENGHFVLDNLLFADTATFYYKKADEKNKDSKIDIKLDSRPTTEANFDFEVPSYPNVIAKEKILKDSIANEKAADIFLSLPGSFNKEATLSEVILISKRKSPVQVVNDKYATGLFNAMGRSKVFDFINEPPQSGALNIFEYLQGKISGLIINRTKTGYEIWSPRSFSLSRGPVPAKIFVDEMEVETSDAMSVPVNQIAFVKYFPPNSLNFPGVGIAPVIAIYTKKGGDGTFIPDSKMNSFVYPGYSPNEVFTVPDYSSGNNKTPDNRITLYWEPGLYITPETSKRNITFYNSDNAKKFRVVVQGITTEGKLVYAEKIIE